MKRHQYDPEMHHRRSIRLKGHDYAGGGMYFVTICAHREFIQFAKGNPFGVGATSMLPAWGNGAAGAIETRRAIQVSPVRELIKERMRITAEKCPFMQWAAAVIMPDHFHALIRIDDGHAPLGDVIGGFKAAVTRQIHRRGDIYVAPDIRIWHRNYYEMIVRTSEAAGQIAEYIRMNPWKNIIHLGDGMRGIGNPSLLNWKKMGMLCSRNCPEDALRAAQRRAAAYRETHCLISGFHSPPEQAILAALLKSHAKIICCPAWGIDKMKIPADWLPALEQNRMLILEMQNENGDLAASRDRNTFVMQVADELWIPHVSANGMLATLIGDMNVKNKIIRN